MIRCGIYLRLSKEDGDGESNSIQNQRLIIRQYIQQEADMAVVKEWSDDGWSGSRFDRPGFQAMMQAVFQGELDCILVKDLSRLGREYIQTGYYLQKIFPEYGVRFISIADHYDSSRTEFMEESLLVPVLNLMNDAYCRDISQKVRWQQRTKRQLGQYIGAFAAYGYKKSQENIHKLEADEEVREIVQGIFWLRLSGMTAEKITIRLNGRSIPSPREYKRLQGSSFSSGFDREEKTMWSPLAVRRILHNEMYTGIMIQGKNEKISYKLNIRKKIPREQWVCVKNTVPVLIPAWVYQRVGEIEKQKIRCKKGKMYCDIWAGILEEEFSGKNPLMGVLFDFFRGEKVPEESWMQRLFLVLYMKKISVDITAHKIYLYSICKKGERKGGNGRDLCQNIRGAQKP